MARGSAVLLLIALLLVCLLLFNVQSVPGGVTITLRELPRLVWVWGHNAYIANAQLTWKVGAPDAAGNYAYGPQTCQLPQGARVVRRLASGSDSVVEYTAGPFSAPPYCPIGSTQPVTAAELATRYTKVLPQGYAFW